MKILIIDDDELIHSMIFDKLTPEGYEIHSAFNCKEGIELADKTPVDIILLDIRMPGMSGLDFMKEFRVYNPDTPVIMLSSLSEEETKIRAFENGADDYMIKPFSTGELSVRIKAILKRSVSKNNEIQGLTIGKGYFDFQQYRFTADIEEECSKYEILILKLLASNAGKVFTRDDILHYAWGAEQYPTNRTIDNYIVRLRDKINRCFAEKPSTDIIESVYGSGYRLNIPDKK